jgi:adenylate cyclase class IV
MPAPSHLDEIEVKLRVPDLRALRGRLKELRAKKISSRTFESNTLYDTRRQDLRRKGRLIRIRVEAPATGSERRRVSREGAAVLTFKGPQAGKGPEAGSRQAPRRRTQKRKNARKHFKVREEAEVSFVGPNPRGGGTGARSGPFQMERILRALGLHPSFRYEKFRTTYALPGIRGLKVELDETPVGTFLELEGSFDSIDRAARLLGYSRSEYLTDSYGSLYLADCKRRGLKPGNMIFQQKN